ncbi:MAG TPA: carboxypeptidase-like regulatory domain-containing protein [Pyrinomonadaceae bacterium]|nr:carboxypeptidase-like regulatory domain-containing protein [Pyrinomonadaceae bacterium]
MKSLAAIFFTLFLFPALALAQVSISTAGPAGSYSQNFNGTFLGTTNYSLTDNAAANLGWYAFRTVGNVSPNVFVADTGASATASFKNYATATATTDRALGSLADNGTGDMMYGLRIQNDTGGVIRSVRIQYTGEQYRAQNNNIQTLAFSYQVSAGDITSLTTGTFTNNTTLDFVSPITGNVAPLDGNAPANRVTRDVAIFVDIPAGGEIMLRWFDANDGANDHGLAIDDVNVAFFVPSAAGVALSGRAVTPEGVGIGYAYVTLSGGTLTEPRRALTNPFGFFSFDNVPSGATYLMEITSKRYAFEQPSRTINVEDSISDIEFVSTPQK